MKIRENRQKTFVTLCGFWALRGCVSLCGWLVGWRESVQKRKFRDKDHFSDNVELSSKKLQKMASADIKPDVKATRHKRTDSCLGYCNVL